MATCKRCEGRRMEPTILPDENGVWRRGEMSCGACKGTGEVEDDDSEREGDNTNKGDGDGDT